MKTSFATRTTNSYIFGPKARDKRLADLSVQVLMVVCTLGAASAARAQANLISNGGFESGTLAGWTVANPGIGSTYDDDGTNVGTAKAGFYASQSDTAPISGLPTLGPDSGSTYALSDMNAESNVAMFQSFTAASTSVTISFDMYVYDWSGSEAYDSSAGLDYRTTSGNQAARVDLLYSSAIAGGGPADYTTNVSAIVATLYGPGADASSQGADPTAPAWTMYSETVGGLTAGVSYALRFAVVDNQFALTQAVDNVSVLSIPSAASAPDASSASLVAAFLLPIVAANCRRRRRIRPEGSAVAPVF